jgi:hypothetical protein
MSLLRLQHRQTRDRQTHRPAIPFVLMLVCLQAVTSYAQPVTFYAHPVALDTQPPGTAIVFYAQTPVSEDLWPQLFQIVRADLADGAGELSNSPGLDKHPILARGSDDLQGITFSQIISVKLLGHCDLLPQADRPQLRGPLGWVPLVSGKIQPFVSIDCTRIAQVLRRTVAHENKQERQYAMTQAIAHVLIHEWIHIAAQSTEHGRRGITQAYLSVDELTEGPKSSGLSIAKQ